MTHSELTRKVMTMLQKEFPLAVCFKVSDRFTSGIPDILICYNGFWAIELKVGKNKPTRLQRYNLSRINTAGGCAAACYSVEEVRNFLTKLE